MPYIADYLNALTSTELAEVKAALALRAEDRSLRSSTAVAHTGTTTETVVATINLTGLVAAGDVMELSGFWSYVNSANIKIARWRLGGTGINGTIVAASGNLTTTAAFTNFKRIFFPTIATQTMMASSNHSDVSTTSGANTTGTVDMSGAVNLYATAELASAGETITFHGYSVKILKG